ncbi:MAG: hypothetical protein ACJ8FF_02145 [Sphingomicrobium sp.]
MLRRLDKLAEERETAPARGRGRGFDAKLALRAVRTQSEENLRAALATVDSDTSDNPAFEGDAIDDPADFSNFGSDRVWQDEDGVWWTNFPPPDDFIGDERGHWSDQDYARKCSEDECDLLAAARDAELSELKAGEEAERDTFFAELKADLAEFRDPGLEPGPASTSAAADDNQDLPRGHATSDSHDE